MDFYAQRLADTEPRLRLLSPADWLRAVRFYLCDRTISPRAVSLRVFPHAPARHKTTEVATLLGALFSSLILFISFCVSAAKETPSFAESPVPEITARFAQ